MCLNSVTVNAPYKSTCENLSHQTYKLCNVGHQWESNAAESTGERLHPGSISLNPVWIGGISVNQCVSVWTRVNKCESFVSVWISVSVRIICVNVNHLCQCKSVCKRLNQSESVWIVCVSVNQCESVGSCLIPWVDRLLATDRLLAPRHVVLWPQCASQRARGKCVTCSTPSPPACWCCNLSYVSNARTKRCDKVLR
jgi:hypothetical protein